MTKIFGEIDTVANPVVFTPWFWKHLTNSIGFYGILYLLFIKAKYFFNRYPINTNKKKYIIMLFLLQNCFLNIMKPHKYQENIPFSIVNALILYVILKKKYLGPNQLIMKKKSLFDKFFSKKYNGKFNAYQPFTQNTIIFITLYIWLYSHTVYEYYTAGNQGKDDWWLATGAQGPPPSTHILSNSYPNSVGDTIGGFLGCCLFINTLKKYTLDGAIPLTIWLYSVTGNEIIKLYKYKNWIVD